MTIADTYNAANNQTCAFGYDDLWRVGYSHCGTVWSQDFSYDQFSNITKTGTSTFNPGYNPANNHVLGSTYDNNGNLINDGDHVYAFDVDSRPINVDGVITLFDAFGRAVEQNHSGTYTQIVYSPSGNKFAFMNQQAVQQYVLPLAAGMKAVFNAAGLQFFRHSDWLGTTRFSTTPTAGVYFDGGWAPYSESYAGGAPAGDRSFTGQTRETLPTSDLYDFLFRQYNAIQGRWMVPDPAGLAAVDIANPQTWNKYGYVGNQPLSNVDQMGLGPCGSDPECFKQWALSQESSHASAVNQGPSGTNWDSLRLMQINVYSGSSQLIDGGHPYLGQVAFTDLSNPFVGPSGGLGSYSGGATTANNGQQQKPSALDCAGQAALAKGLSIGLDVVGMIPVGNLVSGVASEAQSLNQAHSAVVALAGIGTSLMSKDPIGGSSAAATFGISVARGLLPAAKMIPGLGNALSVGTSIYDAAGAVKAYQQCMARTKG